MREAFSLFDTEGTGYINPKELKAAMQSLGFESKSATVLCVGGWGGGYRGMHSLCGVESSPPHTPLTPHPSQMIADIDKSGHGAISFDDFLDLMTAKIVGAGVASGCIHRPRIINHDTHLTPPPHPTPPQGDKDTTEDVSKVFALFDTDKKGRISLKDLQRVAAELGEPMKEEELVEMIERASSSGDGLVSLSDFHAIVRR